MLHRTAHPARWLSFVVLFTGLSASSLARPAADDQGSSSPAQTESVRVLVVRPGDTLTKLLAGAGVEAEDAKPAISALAPIFPPRRLQPGHEVTVRQDPSRDDALLALILEPQPGRTVTVTRSGTGWQATEEEAARHRHLVLARGEVTGTIFQDLQQAGVPPALGLGLVRMLALGFLAQTTLAGVERFGVSDVAGTGRVGKQAKRNQAKTGEGRITQHHLDYTCGSILGVCSRAPSVLPFLRPCCSSTLQGWGELAFTAPTSLAMLPSARRWREPAIGSRPSFGVRPGMKSRRCFIG